MEEKKEKKTIKCSYAVLVIALCATVAFLTDYIIIDRKTKNCDCPKCEATNNEVISGDIENKDNTDNTQVTENDENIATEKENNDNYTYLRDTELTAGCDNEINIKIENGSIIISNGEKTVRYNNVDAKYIHWNGVMQCGSVNLFYITNDNNLYEIAGIYNLFGDNAKFVQPVKKTDNVKEMIEDISSADTYGDTVISNKGLKVLTVDNNVATIYWNSFNAPTGQESTMFSQN